jgi:hypothetical protein
MYEQAFMNCCIYVRFLAFTRIKKGARMSPKPVAISEISAGKLDFKLLL